MNRSELLKEFNEWNKNCMSKMYNFREKWVEANVLRILGTTNIEICKTRCRIEDYNLHAHIWLTNLFIDSRLISVLGINIITMQYRVETTDGFIQTGEL